MSDDAPRIDWNAAEVDDGRLVVPVAGKPPGGWAERVQQVTERLQRVGDWGEVAVKKKQVTVDGVQPGSETDLRHLLESAVLQANADTGASGEAEEPEAERSPEDQQLTDAFRAFGEG